MSARENRTGIFEMPNNPELPDLFRVALRNLKLQLRTHTVATVTAYDPTTQKATVTVDILQIIKDNFTPPTPADPNPTKAQAPVILADIPVAWTRTNSGYQTLPLNPGDTGELHVQDRSLEQWLKLGAATDPISAFTHSLADSVFHPTVHADNNPITPPTDQTAHVIEGIPFIKLGRNATLGIARLNDPVAASAAMTAWALVVETAINALAPGTFTPANSFATTVVTLMGSISGASVKASSE